MLALKLAFKNLLGAGLRTWLNVSVLSFAFVIIVFYNGMLDGWNRRPEGDTRNGKPARAVLAPFVRSVRSLSDCRMPMPSMDATVEQLIREQKLTPVLVAQATPYPQGRMQSIVLKGIDPDQKILKLPSGRLHAEGNAYDAIIGKRMAESSKLKEGDNLLIRWRDHHGTFDAREVRIAAVFDCDVPTVDKGQVYLSLQALQQMMGMENEATLLVAGENIDQQPVGPGYIKTWGPCCMTLITSSGQRKPVLPSWKESC